MFDKNDIGIWRISNPLGKRNYSVREANHIPPKNFLINNLINFVIQTFSKIHKIITHQRCADFNILIS
jgi:hypothetical protein